jgi:NAD(P)H dehydrogenase (quinone)
MQRFDGAQFGGRVQGLIGAGFARGLTMKHALIIAHPNPASFTATMAKAYAEAAAAKGHEVLIRDLYAIGFDPRLGADEIPGPSGFAPHDDVKAERAMLADVGVFAFFYPVWFNAPPAILKGYLDRVFGMGFGYGMGDGGNAPLLTGGRMISVSSSGAPKSWMVETGAWDAMRKLFDEHVAGVCGLAVIDHLHFGGIVPNITSEAVQSCAEEVAAAVIRCFGRSA